MKLLALDLGDVHNGVAISDPLGIACMPLTTIPSNRLVTELGRLITEHRVKTVVVGYPKTMRGGESAQTEKIVQQTETLKKEFPAVEWILWDERLTSKMAASLERMTGGKSKHSDHARAAALILQSYLDHLRFARGE